MPYRYKKRSNGRRNGYGKKRYYSNYVRGGGYSGRMGGGIVSGNGYHAELKFKDTTFTDVISGTGEVAGAAGSNTGFVLIAEGTGPSERIGRSIVVKHLTLKGRLMYTASSGTDQGGAYYNMTVVLDKHANGAYPSFADVYETDEPDSHRNLENTPRFSILKVWRGIINAETSGTSDVPSPVLKKFEFNRKLNMQVQYTSTTGAIAEIRQNNLFMVWVVKQAASDQVNVDLNARVRFTDGGRGGGSWSHR